MADIMIATPEAFAHAQEWARDAKGAAQRAAVGRERAKGAKAEAEGLSISALCVKAIGQAVIDGAPVELVRYCARQEWDGGRKGKDSLSRRSGAEARFSEANFLAEEAGERLRTAAPYWARGEEAPEGLAFQTLVKSAREARRERERLADVADGTALRAAISEARKHGLTQERAVEILAECFA